MFGWTKFSNQLLQSIDWKMYYLEITESRPCETCNNTFTSF